MSQSTALLYSLQDIANACGYSYAQTKRHIKKLKDTGKFEKSGVGKQYNETDCKSLEKLLSCKILGEKPGRVPKQQRLSF